MLVGVLGLLLGCTPDAGLPAQMADRSRVEAVSRRPRVRIPVADEDVRKWTPEIARGECTVRDEDGAVVEITTVNAEGAPMLRELADGGAYGWYRWRDADGVVRNAYVRRFAAGEAYGDVVVDERFDNAGRLVSRHRGPYDHAEWAYDAAGRLVRSWTTRGGDVYEDSYAFAPDGQIQQRAYAGPAIGGDYYYGWRQGRLVEVRHHDLWSDGSLLTWTSHHASGLPEHGEGSWTHSDGNSGVWVEEWAYDDQARPTRHSGGRWGANGGSELWAWDDDHVVLQEGYYVDRDGVERLGSRKEWAWDDEGRILWHDDGKHEATWEWAEDGDLAATTYADHAWTYEGDCPVTLFTLPAPPAPGPLPIAPEPPRAWTR